MLQNTANLILPPLGLYIHLPWCVKKCPYCDFNSYKLGKTLPEAAYIKALIADLSNDLKLVTGRKIATIFFGGGTPSLFSASSIATLLNAINNVIAFADDIEITLEANPGTVESKYLLGYKAAGVNRISLGAQSFNNTYLKKLGRIHNDSEIFKAIEIIKQAQFNNFNIDLMYGLPEQTITQALQDLEIAISCKPQHLSWYELTLEQGTQFYNQKIVLPPEKRQLKMQQLGLEFLADVGFNRYEISGYATAGHQCQHNLNYWQFGDYLGIGAGAHSKITQLEPWSITRIVKQQTPTQYLACNNNFIVEQKILNPTELPLEFMLNALRLTAGFGNELFTQRTNLPYSNIAAIINTARDQALLSDDQYKIQATAQGLLLLNNLLELFMP